MCGQVFLGGQGVIAMAAFYVLYLHSTYSIPGIYYQVVVSNVLGFSPAYHDVKTYVTLSFAAIWE